jgi:GNAT superfamily N-acetyltransferase
MTQIQQITGLPEGLDRLIKESVSEGYDFVEQMQSNWQKGVNRFDQPGEAYFSATRDKILVGVGGINRDPYSEERIGRIRHFYVLPAFRRQGIGSSLLEHIVAFGCQAFPGLRLRTLNPAAALFYEASGFRKIESQSATHILGCSA